jgi:hypothetical protein
MRGVGDCLSSDLQDLESPRNPDGNGKDEGARKDIGKGGDEGAGDGGEGAAEGGQGAGDRGERAKDAGGGARDRGGGARDRGEGDDIRFSWSITGRLGFFVEIRHQTTPHSCITAARWDDNEFSRKTILLVLDS